MSNNPARWLWALCVLTILGAGIAETANAADAREGKKLADRWCSACHFVDGKGRAPDAAPPFGQMADEKAYPDARIRGWLHDPHPPMPNLILSRSNIDNIAAYIRSLGK